MRVTKKEKFYINSLNNPEPEVELPKTKTLDSLKTLKQLREEAILERLVYFNGQVTKTAKSLGINRGTILNLLGTDAVNSTKAKKHTVKKQEFLDTYYTFRGNIKEVAKRLGVTPSRVHQLAIENGLKTISNRKRRKLEPKQLNLFKE